MAHFGVSTHRADGALVVVPTGELDIAAAGTVREQLAARREGENLVLDLRGVGFLDTSGLQIAVEAHHAAADGGYELRILRPPAAIQRVFELAGLDGVLPFADGDGHG